MPERLTEGPPAHVLLAASDGVTDLADLGTTGAEGFERDHREDAADRLAERRHGGAGDGREQGEQREREDQGTAAIHAVPRPSG